MKKIHFIFKGQRYGKLTVIRKQIKPTVTGVHFLCRCVCGTKKLVRTDHLAKGITISCGCHQKTHALSSTRTYRIWMNMKYRCFNPNAPQYKNYGAIGITVADHWLNFQNFFDDIGHSPTDHHSIDRINVNGNYEPGNCRWATKKEQANNRRNNHIIEFKGQHKTLSQWADDLKLPYGILSHRINIYKWSIEKSLTTPYP
jgi:hypothetical protein